MRPVADALFYFIQLTVKHNTMSTFGVRCIRNLCTRKVLTNTSCRPVHTVRTLTSLKKRSGSLLTGILSLDYFVQELFLII
jgi:hypothetical protein